MGEEFDDESTPISRLSEELEVTREHPKIESIEEAEGDRLVITLAEELDRAELEDAVDRVNEEFPDDSRQLELGPNDSRQLELGSIAKRQQDVFSLYLIEDLGGTIHKQKVGPTFHSGKEIQLPTSNPVLLSEVPASGNMAYTLSVLKEYLHQH